MAKVAARIYSKRLRSPPVRALMTDAVDAGAEIDDLLIRFHVANWERVLYETAQWARSPESFIVEHSSIIEEDTVLRSIAKSYDRATAARVWTRLSGRAAAVKETSEAQIARFDGQLVPLFVTYDGPQGDGIFDVLSSEVHFIESVSPGRVLKLGWRDIQYYDKNRDGTLILGLGGPAEPWWPAEQEHLLASRGLQLRRDGSSNL